MRSMLVWMAAISALIVIGCHDNGGKSVGVTPPVSRGPTPQASQPGPVTALAIDGKVEGTGSTFAEAVYQDVWFPDYAKWRREHPPANPIPFFYNHFETPGSEIGLKEVLEGKINFADTDWPLNEDEEFLLTKPKHGLAHIYVPAIIGAIVPIYNVRVTNMTNGPEPAIQFTAEALTGIFDGTIRKWSNPAIQGVNPGLRLPDSDISVIGRSDGSGSTYILSTFLSRRGGWKGKPGMRVSWSHTPYASVAGSEGMVNEVKGTPDSIGYVEFTVAGNLLARYGAVRNSTTGKKEDGSQAFLTPTSARLVASVPKDMPFDPVFNPGNMAEALIETPNPTAYPISAITWFVAPTSLDEQSKGIFHDFLCWVLDYGQIPAQEDAYAQLPSNVRSSAKRAVETYFGSCSAM